MYWVRIPIPIGGVLVDGARGVFQFFTPGKWHTDFISVEGCDGGILAALSALFRIYDENSQVAPDV